MTTKELVKEELQKAYEFGVKAGIAEERLMCAITVEKIYSHQEIESKYAGLVGSVLMDCAAAIRARGQV